MTPERRHIPTAAAAALLLALTLGACTSGEVPSTADPATSGSRPSNGSTERTGDSGTDAAGDDASAAPVPEAAAGSRDTAAAAAENAVTAFARPQLRYDEWIAGLYPLLTQDGAAAHEDTDPATIPVRTVTGPGTVLAGSTELALIVEVPTDAGPYNVSLSRTGTASPWLADRIRPAGT